MTIADIGVPSHQLQYPAGLLLARGVIKDHTFIKKFGFNGTVGTSFVPLARQGIYRTPQAAGARALRIRAGGNANDTAAGSGAREIQVDGLDENFQLATEIITTAGASASALTTTTFTRLWRIRVRRSGTYPDIMAGTWSHAGDIIIEDSGGVEWGRLGSSGSIRDGQSQIGCFSTPVDQHAFITSYQIKAETGKDCDIVFVTRRGIERTAAPYQRASVTKQISGFQGVVHVDLTGDPLPVDEGTDFVVFGRVASGTAEVGVEFNMVFVPGQYAVQNLFA